MFDAPTAALKIDEVGVANSFAAIDALRRLIDAHGGHFGDVLEVGCDNGLNAYVLAHTGARSVHAIDIPEYDASVVAGLTVERQSKLLSYRRSLVAAAVGIEDSAVRFEDLDVMNLDAESAYDLVVSWQTLEHIKSPAVALDHIYRALRPGGLSFHEYNPFFAIDGGHSLCTLDFDWGHARLRDVDIQAYLYRYRTNERDVAMTFYREALNRMTHADLVASVKAAGLDLLMFLPWPDRRDIAQVNGDVLAQVQELYPSVNLPDLVSPRVWVLLRRPE